MLMPCSIYAKIPSFVGDLVARDLSGAGPLGHVGIASAPDYRMRPTVVLEAMNSVPHIQENSIANFKSQSKVWGSKGGLLSPKSLESYTVANRIIRQYYACPEYTITWKWREGKIDSNTRPISCAQFRCDTLVNYAYAFHVGYSLPTYNTTWTTPLAIYNYFPVDSDLFEPIRYSNQYTSQSISHENVDVISESNFKAFNAEDFYQLLQNSPNITKEKIKYLWELSKSNEVNSDIKVLFYDFLSFENPDYLLSEIIQQAKNEHGEVRHKLLVTLQSIYQKKLSENKKTGLKEITDYFKTLQHTNLDKNDGGIIYRGLATLAPKQIKIQNINLTNMDKIHVSVLSLKNGRMNEMQHVKNIIFNLEHPDDSLVVTASYKYLTQLINSNSKFFSKESKLLFKEHLDKEGLLNKNRLMDYAPSNASIYTSSYFAFKAAIDKSIVD